MAASVPPHVSSLSVLWRGNLHKAMKPVLLSEMKRNKIFMSVTTSAPSICAHLSVLQQKWIWGKKQHQWINVISRRRKVIMVRGMQDTHAHTYTQSFSDHGLTSLTLLFNNTHHWQLVIPTHTQTRTVILIWAVLSACCRHCSSMLPRRQNLLHHLFHFQINSCLSDAQIHCHQWLINFLGWIITPVNQICRY